MSASRVVDDVEDSVVFIVAAVFVGVVTVVFLFFDIFQDDDNFSVDDAADAVSFLSCSSRFAFVSASAFDGRL